MGLRWAIKGRQKSRAGFALIEFLIVITIIGIVATIAVPRYTSAAAGFELDRASRQLTADLRWTIQMATNSTNDSNVKIRFSNSAPYGYSIVQGAVEAVIKPMVVFPATVQLASSNQTVAFNVLGRPTDGNNLIVTISNTLGQNRIVTVDAVTGRIRIQ